MGLATCNLKPRPSSTRKCGLDDPVAKQANLHVAAEPVLTPHDLTWFLSLLCQELIPAGRYRYILLQGELDQGLGGTFTWSSLVIISDPAPAPAPTPAPIAAPLPPPARAPMIDPTAAPPTVLFAVLAPRDLPVNS